MKEWEMLNQKWINFYSHNKVIVKICIERYHECWKRRCPTLRNPEVQDKVLKDEVLAIIEEASKEEVYELRRYIEVHSMNVNNASVNEILS